MEEILVRKKVEKEEKDKVIKKIEKAVGNCHCDRSKVKIQFRSDHISILVENYKTAEVRAALAGL